MTSSGEVLTASATENPDLFWAIRGGGSNFGIVTEFVLQLHPQRKTVFAGIVVYEGSKAEALTQVVKEWWEAGQDGRDTIFQGFTTGPDGNVRTLIIIFNSSDGLIDICIALRDLSHVLERLGRRGKRAFQEVLRFG